MKYLITGVAGFIGMHVAKQILQHGGLVVGVDCITDYYDIHLKRKRLAELKSFKNFIFYEDDITSIDNVKKIFKIERYDRIIHLAAQPGVRQSFINPHLYIQNNIIGFLNLLESAIDQNTEHFVYASSSSVYGENNNLIQNEKQITDTPLSIYGVTKKTNELMAFVYGKNYGIKTSGLRYFTVYGPWGRPDMSPWIFTNAIIKKEPINIFNHGEMVRDYTYIDDIAKGTVLVANSIPVEITNIYNIGSHSPIKLINFIELIEKKLGIKAIKNYAPTPKGDVISTFADVSHLKNNFNFMPKTNIDDGLTSWLDWYLKYHGLSKI